MKRSDVTEVPTTIYAVCRVQQNPDGTWTAIIRTPPSDTGPITRESVVEAINAAKEHYRKSRTGT